jgi:GTP-binding protein
MLVTDIAGTTRDAIDSHIEVDGSKYVFVDTSGIRRRSKINDPIERYSVVRAFKSIERCHLAFVMLDAVRGLSEQDARIAGYAHNTGRATVLVVNKWDLVEKDSSTAGHYAQQIRHKLKYLEYAPIIFISALTGQRVFKTLELADEVFAQFNRRVSTSEVNVALEAMVNIHHPPVHKGRQVKFYYGTQAAVRPPTFVLFCNAPEGVHFSYERYLINQFRERFQLPATPIKLRIQQR